MIIMKGCRRVDHIRQSSFGQRRYGGEKPLDLRKIDPSLDNSRLIIVRP